MIPFTYHEPANKEQAFEELRQDSAMPLAGGTTMLDLMKLNVLVPEKLVHVSKVLHSQIQIDNERLVVGAACTMNQLANHPEVKDKLSAIRHSLILAASPQIRNMATLGGNLLQRTRSTYFRHTDMPVYLDGADTASQASEGVDTSLLAILGNDGRLVGMYPGDFAVSVVAFDAQLSMEGPDGSRTIAARDFYRTPGKSFQYTTVLKQGELITSISFPISASLRNSMYLKIRERSSYAFALASASVGLQLEGSGKTAKIVAANVGLGGLASIPWHSEPAVESLVGKQASDSTFEKAAEAALADAKPPAGLEYKIPLAKRTLMRALRTLRDQGPPDDSQLWSFQHGRA